MDPVIWKNIQKLVNLPNLIVIGLNAKARLAFKMANNSRELSMYWVHTKLSNFNSF